MQPNPFSEQRRSRLGSGTVRSAPARYTPGLKRPPLSWAGRVQRAQRVRAPLYPKRAWNHTSALEGAAHAWRTDLRAAASETRFPTRGRKRRASNGTSAAHWAGSPLPVDVSRINRLGRNHSQARLLAHATVTSTPLFYLRGLGLSNNVAAATLMNRHNSSSVVSTRGTRDQGLASVLQEGQDTVAFQLHRYRTTAFI